MKTRQLYDFVTAMALGIALAGCTAPPGPSEVSTESRGQKLLSKYTEFTLTTDLAQLTEGQREMIPLLIEAAREMDAVFWKQASADGKAWLDRADDDDLKEFVRINYGPWDRLDGNAAFLENVGPKPPGANFYPVDMTAGEFEEAFADQGPDSGLKSLYTLVRRDEEGGLSVVPYHTAYAEEHRRAAAKLREAAELAEDPGFKQYLELRAEALLTDRYQPSDLAWMDMKENALDIVIGPIETYEDQLFGYKAAHEAYVLVKDQEWSRRLARYTEVLPELQRGLPVEAQYKNETPGRDSDLNAYDVIYYAGDCNAGSKTIAINLPNDEEVQLKKGTRRLQLKNAMRAKFDKILRPVTDHLIAEDQRSLVTFDAFFANTMFHEVAHGLGIKNTINDRGTVRQALKEQASALEEGKADVLGLYMVKSLLERDEWTETRIEENYVSFVASIFRSIRFGASSAHGRANLVRFNFFEEQGAFVRDPETGTYRIDLERIGPATDALSAMILKLQGDGDYEGVQALMDKYGKVGSQLRQDLDRLSELGIPVDIVFRQGLEVLR